MNKNYSIVIIGAGPAGLSAASAASPFVDRILILDENFNPGGQLIKQTHQFFGSREHYAGVRGFDIAQILVDKIHELSNVTLMKSVTALGIYGNELSYYDRNNETYNTVNFEKIIIATGASEKMLALENNDLPGIFGAGAVQTLMNVDGVRPGDRVVMVGAGNIGLIVSYQLMQSGVEVSCIIEGSPEIGGYHVHAAKIRRMGIPILTSHTITKALGTTYVEGAEIVKLDDKWNPVSGSAFTEKCDVICLAVGLNPATELLHHAKCDFSFNAALGGWVARRSKWMQTSNTSVYIAGDVASIEEASAAMLEGRMAGLCAAFDISGNNEIIPMRESVLDELDILREGPFSDKVRENLPNVEFIGG